MKTVLILAWAFAASLSQVAHAGGSDIDNSVIESKTIQMECFDVVNGTNDARAQIFLDKGRTPSIFMKLVSGQERHYNGAVSNSQMTLIQAGWDMPKVSVGSINAAVLKNNRIGQEYRLNSDLGGFLCRVVNIAK